MLNGNAGSAIAPHPQSGVPDIQDVQSEGQAKGVVEKPTEVVSPGAAEFQGPRICVHAPRYEWHPEVQVQGLDEEAHQRNVVMEELLHRFGVRTKAREHELHQRLVQSQAAHADLVKDLHELRQFTIVKLGSCTPALIYWRFGGIGRQQLSSYKDWIQWWERSKLFPETSSRKLLPVL